MRSLLTADALAARGATVTRWASTLDHGSKEYVAEPGYVEVTEPGLEFRLLHGRPYRKNVSLRRILHQRDVARDFRRRRYEAPKPDLIFAALPTIDLADDAMAMAREWNVPGFIDFRDLWPEIFLDVSPLPRGLTRALIQPLYAQARRAMSHATGVISITPAFLDKALGLAGRDKREADHVFVHAYQRTLYSENTLREAEEFWRGQKLKLDGSEIILCLFGNLSAVVQFQPMLEGIAALDARTRKNLRVVICGTGDALTMLSASGISELVLPGFVDGAKIASLMAHATAGLLPYPNRSDLMLSYPNKVGEYLSGGLPILSSLGGVLKALIEDWDAGIHAEGKDGWANGLNAIILDEARRAKMKANAARLYNEVFNADHVYGAFADHLLQFIRPDGENQAGRD